MTNIKPMLFNTEMVRAIQNDRKTVTRRVVPDRILDNYYAYDEYCNYVIPHDIPVKRQYEKEFFLRAAPYQPGDILYVRETFMRFDCSDCMVNAEIGTFCPRHPDENGGCFVYRASDYVEAPIWRPSIHMPKEAARIFLRVTDVRVERLQDITEEEAHAEGFSSRSEFIDTFLKMYPDCTLESWLWVIEFEKISKEEAMK